MSSHLPIQEYDILVIGSGAAGLGVALSLPTSQRIAILSKNDLFAGSSRYAQGGIAAVLSQSEAALAAHIEDTLNAGAGLCERDAVEFTVKHARESLLWLMKQGVEFSRTAQDELHLGQEGGHTQRRILHSADHTGHTVVTTLLDQAKQRANITLLSNHMVSELIHQDQQCLGAITLTEQTDSPIAILANTVILASGGASSVYRHTSNPDFTSGDGIAIASRVGASIRDIEFNQFHPTCLYHPNAQRFLITEALRGEGATLCTPNGERFMPNYHPAAELAPRDIVARAIHQEMSKHQLECVFLDATALGKNLLEKSFPTVYKHCMSVGLDISTSPIPVVPAAHYTCGGVHTNLSAETNIKQLFAVGEVAHTGLHGANRMASNSLLECLVFATSAAKRILETLNDVKKQSPQRTHQMTQTRFGKAIDADAMVSTIRDLMWDTAGIVRKTPSLKNTLRTLQTFQEKINTAPNTPHLTKSFLECENLLTVSMLIVKAALNRQDSVGLHYLAE